MDILNLLGRSQQLFLSDLRNNEKILSEKVKESSFLILGGAGSIGQAVTKEIFKRSPKKLHVIDLSENNLVELVRDIRSTLGYIDGEFKTYALDIGSSIYNSFIENDGKYDYVLNLSALKHVRSEKDPFTLMRMIEVNILNTIKTIKQSKEAGIKKYFCVSTDKAANPVNMMGASKRIMEYFLMQQGINLPISTARFANVAFSDGSLLYGFQQRLHKRQPIVAPNDIKRYFVTPQEAGELCLMSCLLGDHKEIFFPKLTNGFNLISFQDIAQRFLQHFGYEPFICNSEEEARHLISVLPLEKRWPCYFSGSDTTGEKAYEEFYMDGEELDLDRFLSIGIVKNSLHFNQENLNSFLVKIENMMFSNKWTKEEILELFNSLIPGFDHLERGKDLDGKM